MTLFYLDSGGASGNSGTTDSNSATASGTSNATILANKTFASATDVDATNNLVTVTSHGYSTGMGIELTTSSALPGGLSAAILYFVRSLSANTLAFYLSPADAGSDTNRVDITSNGTGTQTINNKTVQLGGSPNLSTVTGCHARCTTSGTSHVITFDNIHGLSTGDRVYIGSGTTPTGLAATVAYFVNALSTTTVRLYNTNAAAITGGASALNVSLANSHFTLASDKTQCINLASATNSNRKIFYIRTYDDTNDWVVVDLTVTGLGAGSTWAIGGRGTVSTFADVLNAARGLDTLTLNTDLSGAIGGTPFFRNINASGAYFSIVGKAGARRVLTATNNGQILGTGVACRIYCENIEFQAQGTGAATGSNAVAARFIFLDCRFTDAGSQLYISQTNSNCYNAFIRCEFTGAGATAAVQMEPNQHVLYQCNVHDNTGAGVALSGTSNAVCMILDTIIERNTDRGLFNNSGAGSSHTWVCSSTIYHNDNSGYELTGVNAWNLFGSINSIWKDNGNAAGEYNIETAFVNFYSRKSTFSVGGSRGGDNVQSNVDMDSTDITSDPLFVDPDNGTPASRNFGLQAGSPCKDISYTFLGSGTVTHRDMGAIQSNPAGSGGGAHIIGGSIVR